MKSFVLVVTVAFLAVQLTCAIPTSENEKKDTADGASPNETIQVSPRATEAKPEGAGITGGLEDATLKVSRDASNGTATAGDKESILY